MEYITVSFVNTFDNTTEAGKQCGGLFELLASLRERILTLMKSEFGVDAEDDDEFEQFISPALDAIFAIRESVTDADIERMIWKRRHMHIDPTVREWSRVGDGAFEVLSVAYVMVAFAFQFLQDGDIVESAASLGAAHEFLGKAYQQLYDRKFLGISAKNKAAKRHEGHYSIREEAYRLAREKAPPSGQWQSRLSAATAIRPAVKAFAESIGKPLPGSDDAILKTIYMKWLPKMPDADTLFAGRRTTSGG